MTESTQGFSLGTDLQAPVKKFAAALGTPRRLLALAPTEPGNPGDAGALNSALVLTTISAFEGFAEDFMATFMALEGYGLAHIAKEVGRWNNPTLRQWTTRLRLLLDKSAQQTLNRGPTRKIKVVRQTPKGNWSLAGKAWRHVLDDADAWMEVRHLLTHGVVTGGGPERWPKPLRRDAPPAASVLRPKTDARSSLDRAAAKSCARIYTLGARHVAGVAASDLDVSLDWSDLPDFS